MWSRRNLRPGSAVRVGEIKGSGSFQHSSICPGTLQNHEPPFQRPAVRQDPRRGIFLPRVQEERSAWIYSGWGGATSPPDEDLQARRTSTATKRSTGGAPGKKSCGWRESCKKSQPTQPPYHLFFQDDFQSIFKICDFNSGFFTDHIHFPRWSPLWSSLMEFNQM